MTNPTSSRIFGGETSTLVFNWAALMALSLLLALAAHVAGHARPGAALLAVIAVIAAVKSRIVLRAYLGLASAPGALAGFFSVIVGVLALVAASFVILPTPARPFPAQTHAHVSSSTAGVIE